MSTSITVRGLSKTFRGSNEEVAALRGVDLEVQAGEFFVLLGPSGSGKTTLLRCVAGLESPDAGEIRFGGELIFSGEQGVQLPPEQRRIGMVFQSYAIWPHLTVFDNVAVPLRYGKSRIPKALVRERVHDALKLVGMEAMASRPAPLLSGGQQQRVALARALAMHPAILLMDEPLSNLDARLREEVRHEVKSLIAKVGVTVLYVTHDQAEALDLADRIAVMHAGEILQIGPPEALYRSPERPEVAQFLGTMNWIAGTWRGDGIVETPCGALEVDDDPGVPPGSPVTLGIRPEVLELLPAQGEPFQDNGVMRGRIVDQTYQGDHRIYRIEVRGLVLLARAPWDQELTGEVDVHIPSQNLALYPGSWRLEGQEEQPEAPGDSTVRPGPPDGPALPP